MIYRMGDCKNHYEEDTWDITRLHEILAEKWRRKKRSPLKFVEAYDALEEKVGFWVRYKAEEPDQFKSDHFTLSFLLFIEKMDAYLRVLEKDYSSCIPEADAQRKRNEYWKDVYGSPGMPWRGGRADGNGR